MRRFFAAGLTLLLVCAATALAVHAADGTVYGKGVTLTESVPIADLMADPEAWVGKRVRVEGLVVDVCKKRGCWMELAGGENQPAVRIKVEDGVIVFPIEARGHEAVAEGVFTRIVLDDGLGEAHSHEGHDAESCRKETRPGVIYLIRGTGAIIR
ncbi:MAG: hypothetical protein Kow0062_22250 [Acidobacteriota bacterium]